MKADYKAILCAVQKRDKAISDLGDALVTECGLIQRAPVTLVPVGCVRLGFICRKTDATTALRSYRNFGVWRMCSDSRLDGSIFRGNCTQAGTPEMLEAIIGGIPKGTPLTKSYIASIRKQWKRHQREEAKE